jgi:hypothetical protein
MRLKARATSKKQPKRLIFDEPFWVVMKQIDCHPYFVAQVNNA